MFIVRFNDNVVTHTRYSYKKKKNIITRLNLGKAILCEEINGKYYNAILLHNYNVPLEECRVIPTKSSTIQKLF